MSKRKKRLEERIKNPSQCKPAQTRKFTRSFITGSWVYGCPRPESFNEEEDEVDPGSDVDLVILVSAEELDTLIQEGDQDSDHQGSYEHCTGACLRFGKLNLICVTKDEDFQLWQTGTKILRQLVNRRAQQIEKETGQFYEGLEREEAVALFDRLRKQAEKDYWNSPAMEKLTACGLLTGVLQKIRPPEKISA